MVTNQRQPGAESVFYTPRTPRVIAARKLQQRRHRDERCRFLAEGPQTVREAAAIGAVEELFHTQAAADRYPDLVLEVARTGGRCSPVTEEALLALAQTPHPQGIVAICQQRDLTLDDCLGKLPERALVAVLVDIRDPGNAGTVLRTADAAGASAVIFAGQTVDPYNGKCVRASAGSLFHVEVVREAEPAQAVAGLRAAGLRVLATHLTEATDLTRLEDSGALADSTGWLFGTEAHGLPADLADLADLRVRVPIYGRAESLNLAAAAAVCLYASARALRKPAV